MNIKYTLIFIGSVLFALMIGFFSGTLTTLNSDYVNDLEYHQKRLDSTNLRISGGGTLCSDEQTDYDFRSWDGGKNWYAVDFDYKKGTLKVLGVADTIYPGILECQLSWDKLTKHVIENGSINILDSNDLNKLEGTGLTVEINQE